MKNCFTFAVPKGELSSAGSEHLPYKQSPNLSKVSDSQEVRSLKKIDCSFTALFFEHNF
jgi:hypothetical protein